MHTDWQPTLIGSSVLLRPLVEGDFEALFSAASDPLIWEQHPDRERYRRERFEIYFRSGMDSQGALAITDPKSGRIIGSSRFWNSDSERSAVEIGYTFLTREHWGQGRNRELKRLMMGYAFQHVKTIFFVVGRENFRSQKAVAKIGATGVPRSEEMPARTDLSTSVVFKMEKPAWFLRQDHFEISALGTSRLLLEPVLESHTREFWELFKDSELHHFVPFEPESLEKQRERCARWAKRRSPDGTELWLNWAARDRATGKMIAHFQAGVKADGVASIGYVVAREFQGIGIATEGLQTIFSYLEAALGVVEVKAWVDTRNKASHRLAARLGMNPVAFIKDADHFKGSSSDETVFSKRLMRQP